MTDRTDPRKDQDEHPRQPPAEEGKRDRERTGGSRREMDPENPARGKD
ncbi:hypothetical protein [Parvularcula oceani]|nr:hypothetical protein [Parvularcula oceani]